MDSEEGRISVWVCRQEKIILGLSKRTTCSDVVKVLLEDPSSRKHLQAASTHDCYCIVEKWRSFQRILPNKTRIWRLWVAWGEQRDQVKFVLMDSEVFVDKCAARSAEARVVVLSKPNPFVSKWNTTYPLVVDLPPDKQCRIVRKAFRKLEKMQQKKRRDFSSSSSTEKMQNLAHLVVSQDNTIRLQALRIQELDAEIESRETQVHVDRTRSHGINYVQDTYLLLEDDAGASSQQMCSLEVFFHLCEELMRLQEKLWEQEALADMLTMQMEEELNHHWMQRRLQEMHRSTREGQEDPVLFLEEERLRSQLDVSLYIGLRLRSDLEAIRGDLELSRQICSTREEEMRDLLEKMNSLGLEDGANTEGETDEDGGMRMRMMMSVLERKSEWVEQARGLSKCHRGNDDDSDTGLSSLHSQESDSLTVCESLV